MAQTPPRCTVIYNGACPVCDAGIAVIRSDTDGTDYADITQQPDPLAEHGITAEDVQYRLHAVTADGRLVRGIDAVAETLTLSENWVWAGRLAKRPGFRQIGWVLYEITAFALFRWNKWKGNF